MQVSYRGIVYPDRIYPHCGEKEIEKMDNKMKALMAYLEETDIDELTEETYDHYGLSVYSFGSQEYAIGTEEEVHEAVEQNIKDSLCYFNSQWIVDHIDTELPVKAIAAIQAEDTDGNETLFELISKLGDWSYFVNDSILADGRGHFLSSYDGEENEVFFEGVWYFIYRTN